MLRDTEMIHWFLMVVYGALLALFWLWLSGKAV